MQCKYVFGYLRLSRDDEDRSDESNSIRNQKLLIQQFIEANEDLKAANTIFFADDGYSGTNFNRPDFKKMMEMIKSKSSCCVIVKDLSRLGRDTIETQQYIEKIFPFLLVRFIAINDYYDSSDMMAARKDTEVKFKNLVNGIYPQICSQNIKKVMRKRAEMGKYSGSMPPYGYMFKNGDRTVLFLDEEVSGNVRFIFDKRMEGKKYAEIAKMLNEREVETPTKYLLRKGYTPVDNQFLHIWNRYMVKKVLSNPVYAGMIVNHKTEKVDLSAKSCKSIPREEWICIPGMHENIVTEEEMNLVRNMAIKNKKTYQGKAKTSVYIFKGKLKCGYCKRAPRVRNDCTYPAISCETSKSSGQVKCFVGHYKVAELERLLLELIHREAELAENTLKQIKRAGKTLNLSKLKKRMKEQEEKGKSLKQQKMRAYESYAEGTISKEEFLSQKKILLQKEHQYQRKVEEFQEQITQVEEKKKLEKSSGLLTFSKYKDLEELSYEVIQELVEVIYFYDPEHIEVIWNYRDKFLEAEKALT